MTKADVSKVIRNVQRTMSKHSPQILIGLGITGMVSTTVLAVRATPKALLLIEEAEQHKKEKLKPIEVVKTTWKCYIPAVISGSVATACLIGANSVHAKRNAALAAAYKLSEAALSDYREQVIETIGEKKEQVVRDKVAQEHIKKNPVETAEFVTSKYGGTTKCFDYMAGRYFDSDIERIKKAINCLNGNMLRYDEVTLNDFYDEIGLPHAGIGDEFGWNSNRVGRDLIQLSLSYGPDEEDNPCAVIAFNPMPQPIHLGY